MNKHLLCMTQGLVLEVLHLGRWLSPPSCCPQLRGRGSRPPCSARVEKYLQGGALFWVDSYLLET